MYIALTIKDFFYNFFLVLDFRMFNIESIGMLYSSSDARTGGAQGQGGPQYLADRIVLYCIVYLLLSKAPLDFSKDSNI